MHNMLIVDDEKFAVQGICNCRDWQALGIDTVNMAYNADEARKIMLENRIDILICDIEMPDEDGISLIRWVKDHYPQTESLFLTCHTEFKYAKQAVHLGSFDYLLKPVDSEELAEVVTRMIQVIKEKEEQSHYNGMYQKYRSLWNKQQPVLAERFWQDLLSRRILSFGDFLDRAIQDAQIQLSSEEHVLPILISIEEWKKPLNDREQEIMEYAVKKSAEELLLAGHPGHVIVDKNGLLFVMIYASDTVQNIFSSERWIQAGKRFIEACDNYFFCRVSCYVGYFASFQELSRQCEGLKDMERNNLTKSQTVLLYRQQVVQYTDSSVPVDINVSEWSSYLLSGNRDKLIDLIHLTYSKLEVTPDIHSKHIETYYHDILQVIYHFLHVKGISVNQIPNFSLWTSVQIRSLVQFKNWAMNLVYAVMEAVFDRKETDGFVQKAIEYMKAYVEEDISRDDVAVHVCLNPAYLSRLFKKETGKNLIDYLIETKTNRAKELLDSTEMTVSAIAQQVGYSNFSHFTRMFKKQYGVNPQEYRRR